MAIDFDTTKHVGDIAIRVDQERAALNADALFPIKIFLFENTIGLAHQAIGIAEQRKGNFELGLELLV